ncbi:hypothetical protein [Kitasatospora cineracea]|uniref:hypothetical protein n=1 Tax=Kitasatospora cineracea TaxID=88074 RepID=UPI0037F2D202
MNEDKAREFAGHVREFTDNADASHQQPTATTQQLVQACHVVATALAAAFIADQAAAVATLGAAEAAVILIEEAAKRLINYLEQQLEQYIIGQVIEAAIGPLVDTVANAVSGMVFQAAESALGVSGGGGGGGGGTGFRIDPDALDEYARMMHEHAETVAGHAQAFQSKLAGVSFE